MILFSQNFAKFREILNNYDEILLFTKLKNYVSQPPHCQLRLYVVSEKGGGGGGRSRVMTKPPRVGICLGRSKAYLCLKFLGRSRPRLIHFLKIRPLVSILTDEHLKFEPHPTVQSTDVTPCTALHGIYNATISAHFINALNTNQYY